jgi:hypothetical protein
MMNRGKKKTSRIGEAIRKRALSYPRDAMRISLGRIGLQGEGQRSSS